MFTRRLILNPRERFHVHWETGNFPFSIFAPSRYDDAYKYSYWNTVPGLYQQIKP